MRMDPETKYRVASCLVVLCLVACVLGFAAICIAIPRIGYVDFDYMGIIVGILSLLVTVLMAWNIYTVIDSSGKIKRIEDFVENESKRMKEENGLMREMFNGLKLTVCCLDGEMNYISILNYSDNQANYGHIEYAIDGCIDAINVSLNKGLGNDKIEVAVNSLKHIIEYHNKRGKNISILEGKRLFYFDVLSKIETKNENVIFLCCYFLDSSNIEEVKHNDNNIKGIRVMSEYNPDYPSYKGKS